MAENNNPASEQLQKTGQAASAAVNTARATAKFAKGAAKLGKSIAAAAKGASAGGVWGAIASFAWENRRLILKITIAASAVLLIPTFRKGKGIQDEDGSYEKNCGTTIQK